MTIAKLPPIPLRTQSGFPLSSLTHDTIHSDMAATIAILVDTVNTIIAATGTSVPTGVSLAFAGSVLPSGFLWENGGEYSRTTYADLYAALGGASSPWGQGNGTTTFNVPKPQGRSRIYANPINSISADTPTLTARTLGTKYGAESYTNAAVAVTANVPALSVPHSSLTAAFTSTNSFTPTGTIVVVVTDVKVAAPAFTSGTGTFTATNSSDVYTPTGTISGQACSRVIIDGEPTSETVMSCVTLGFSATNSAAAYTPTGTVAITGVTMAAPAFISGAATGTFTATNSFTPTGTVAFGGTQTTAITAITGATASIVVPTITPSLTYNSIIKY